MSGSDLGFRFRFTVQEHGWATIELRPSGTAAGYRWRVSYLSDALGNFLRAAGDVWTGRRPSATATWELEPAVVRCRLQRAAENSVLCGLSVAASESAPSRVLTSFSVPAEQFVAEVLAGSADIDRAAYAASWSNFRFPDDELAVLAGPG
jgi:hypothetical protein